MPRFAALALILWGSIASYAVARLSQNPRDILLFGFPIAAVVFALTETVVGLRRCRDEESQNGDVQR